MPTALQDPFPSVQLTWQMNSNGPGRGAQRSSEPCSFVTDSLVSNGHAGTEGRSQEQSPGWEKLERTGRQVTQRSDISVRVTCGGKERDRKRERERERSRENGRKTGVFAAVNFVYLHFLIQQKKKSPIFVSRWHLQCGRCVSPACDLSAAWGARSLARSLTHSPAGWIISRSHSPRRSQKPLLRVREADRPQLSRAELSSQVHQRSENRL